MSYIEIKFYHIDVDTSYFMVCDYPGCMAEYRGTELELIDEGWKLAKIERNYGTKKIALCPDHSDRAVAFVKKELRELKNKIKGADL